MSLSTFALLLYRRLVTSPAIRQRVSHTVRLLSPRLYRRLVNSQQDDFLASIRNGRRSLEEHPLRPTFSIVIPVYDRTDMLRDAINSVLAQTFTDFELIIVSDGSPPATLQVLDEFRTNPKVRIFSYPRSSGTAVRGRNRGIFEARGTYVAFLDSDDVALPWRLEATWQAFETTDADVVYGGWKAKIDGTREIDNLVDGQDVYSPPCDFDDLLDICVPCQSTVALKRDLLEKYGYLKAEMRYREDHELWLRLAYRGARFYAIQGILTELRLHSGNNELNFKSDDDIWKERLHEQYFISGPLPKKVLFLVAGVGISGGLRVILDHATHLASRGFIVELCNVSSRDTELSWYDHDLPIISIFDLDAGRTDVTIATFWTTARFLDYVKSRSKIYFVQSDERLFYQDQQAKLDVASTYNLNVDYVVVATWLKDMLARDFGKDATVVQNGVDLELFSQTLGPDLEHPGDLRVLIEGPVSVPMKGVANAYLAASATDCKICLVSSDGSPPAGWKVDNFYYRVPFKEMPAIYSNCDVLLKMSEVESFCLPALEAMAAGCAVIVAEVDGAIEFVVDGLNAIVVPKGDIAAATAALRSLAGDRSLRRNLTSAGRRTAAQYNLQISCARFEEYIKSKCA